MTANTLSSFIRDNIEPILQAWEDFARTVEPPALTMDDAELRDHAHQMLTAFAHDLETTQSELERVEKSEGRGDRDAGDTAAETHAEARLLSGYTVDQLVSEYRALRSSVLALWSKETVGDTAAMMDDMTRFNEAVDQALAESVARYERLVKQSRDMFLAILGHDLRNPLSVLTSGSSFIMQASDIPPKYVLAATRMFNGSKRMAGLISDLIDFTRTASARVSPSMPRTATSSGFATRSSMNCAPIIPSARSCSTPRPGWTPRAMPGGSARCCPTLSATRSSMASPTVPSSSIWTATTAK